MSADDTKLLKEISSVADATQLNNDLSNFQKSSCNAGLQLNISKCKSMQITRKHHPIEFTYKLQCANGEAVIERTEQERDLGVWTTSNLSWSRQVSEQCVRGNKMLGYIKRSTHNIKSLAARRTLLSTNATNALSYKRRTLNLVRPQLGYAAQVWAPQSIELIARLEQLQRRALKYILDLPFITNTTYSQRLSQLQLLPLTYWHEYLDLIFFFKCVNGIIDVNNETSPKPARSNKTTRSTDANCFLYETKLCHTSTYQKSFISRTIRTWNTLAKPIRSNTNSLSSFKSLLFKYYTTALNNNYNVNDSRTWKTVCLKCNQARDLTEHITCCF